jgi:HEAT repeat protein
LRCPAGVIVTAAAALFWTSAALAQPPADPVEQLRQAMPISFDEARDAKKLLQRQEVLEKLIDNLQSANDLRRALTLPDWKDDYADEGLRKLDSTLRVRVADRLIQAVSKRNDPTLLVAATTMIGEMGAASRQRSYFGRGLSPLLKRLTENPSPAVREAAVRALGRVNPDPVVAAPALGAVLQKGGTAERRAAAESLDNLMRFLIEINRKGKSEIGVSVGPEELLTASEEVARAVGVGIADSDAAVRRFSLNALLQTADAVGGMFPPPQRNLTDKDRQDIIKAWGQLREEKSTLKAMVQALHDQGERLARALEDPDPAVRLGARRVLESVAALRMKLWRKLPGAPPEVLPPPEPVLLEIGAREEAAVQKEGAAAGPPKDDPLWRALRPSVRILARHLKDPDVRLRLAAIDFLERLEVWADEAVAALVDALGDPDRFVRWSAARTLFRLGPIRANLVVPGLARLVSDCDLDVRLMGIYTLENYRAEAAPAVPALTGAVSAGDTEARVAAIHTLGAIGPKAAPAIPSLIEALAQKDARVRRAAAETLGRLGPRAADAADALRRALNDDDAPTPCAGR